MNNLYAILIVVIFLFLLTLCSVGGCLIMNGIYSEFAEEGLNNKKYIVYEKLNKLVVVSLLTMQRTLVSMQRRFLQIMGLLCLRTTEKLGKMSLRQNLFQLERER